MKKIIIILVLIAGGAFLLLNSSSAPNDVELANISEVGSEQQVSDVSYQDFDASTYEYEITSFNYQFTGYGPGKSHVGEIESNISDEGDIVVFFNCEEYPTSSFTVNSVNPVSSSTARVSGVYEMKGVSKNVSFVADVVEGSNNLSPENMNAEYKGQFMLDTSEFNFQVPIVDDNVLIEFDVSVNAVPVEVEESEDPNEDGVAADVSVEISTSTAE